MINTAIRICAGALATLCCNIAASGQTAKPREARIVGYQPNWDDDLADQVKRIDWAHITHLNLAFENPTNDDGDMSFKESERDIIKTAHSHGVKVLVSLGGGYVSEQPKPRARLFKLISEPNRKEFAAKLAAYTAAHDFDGLDVDIEGPAINSDYGPFVTTLGKELRKRKKLMTSALSQGNGGDRVSSETLALFDFINIMAYDFTGPWAPNMPGQHAPMEFAISSIEFFHGKGVPLSKLVLGVPFYGWGFGKAKREGDYSFSDLVKNYPGAQDLDQVGNTIFYNGIPTILLKTKYVHDQGLGGIMIWPINYDAAGKYSLVKTIYDALHPHSNSN